VSICYGAPVSFLFPSTEITFEAALRDIASSNSKARAAAAHALGDVTDPVEKRRASDALVRALDDDSPQVRMEACASLGDLGEPGTLTHLVKRLADGAAPVRRNAAIALGTIGHADGFEPLAEALREGPADLRFQAATSLAEIDPARAFEPVMRALDDNDPQVVGAAALALGAIAKDDAGRRETATTALADHLDAGGDARFDLAYALAELGDARGRETLAKACTDEERAWDAVNALAELRATEDLLHAVANKKTVAEARVLAAGKLLALDKGSGTPTRTGFAEGSSDAARTVLLEGLLSRKGHVRGLAVEQLAEVGGAWAKAPLEKLARSGRASELLEAIAGALQAIGARS
jgi:HEAT repeat protein